ncbi:MAG: enoyl-CoA hydratase-related protein [Chloroflexota bacterium]
MADPKVLTERRDRTWVVKINRKAVRNCVDGETAGLLHQAVDAFKADDSLDVMILTGAGEVAFCAGADLKNLGTLTNRPGAGVSGPMGISRITDVGKPTIAAINGYCTAGGLELASWCDFRIADKTAQFGVLNRRWGVPLADGGTQRLPQIVGMGNAMYLIITGAQIKAETALRMGFIQEIAPAGKALDRALEIASVVSTYPQPAMRNDRKAALAWHTMPIDEGLRYEVEVHRESLGDPAMAQWLTRFAAGERPQPIRPPE